jgi:hypothetical protein
MIPVFVAAGGRVVAPDFFGEHDRDKQRGVGLLRLDVCLPGPADIGGGAPD